MAGLQWENIRAIRLRGLSASDAYLEYTLAVMDAMDLNKVLMVVNYNPRGFLEVIGVNGQPLFTVTNLEEDVTIVSIGDNEIGKITKTELEGTQDEALLMEVANTPPASNLVVEITQTFLPNRMFSIKDSAQNLVGQITHLLCPSVVDLRISKAGSMHQNIVVLTLAIKCSIGIYRIHRKFVPTLEKISVASRRPDLSFYQNDNMDFGVASTLTSHHRLRIRAAGYSSELGRVYIEIINPISNKVLLTCEFDPVFKKKVNLSRDGGKSRVNLRGSLLARNGDGVKTFSIIGVLNEQISYIFSGQDKFIGYLYDDKFLDSEGNKLDLYCVEVEREDPSRETATARVIEIYGLSYVKQAEISQDQCVVELFTHIKYSAAGMAFVLSRALIASMQTFGLHARPLPDIRYLYRESSGDSRPAIA